MQETKTPYYKIIDGKKYDNALLEFANKAIDIILLLVINTNLKSACK